MATPLLGQAESQIAEELAGLNNPLQNQIGQLGSQQGLAHTAIGSEFAGLMPWVQESAQRVGNTYQSSLQMEQSIFQAAGQRMNQLKQDRAAEAQQLAQQMGGPVATGEFTQGLTPYNSQMPASEASNMLHGLGLAQAGVQEAQQFAGQVMTALQTEQMAKSDEFFQGQIKSLRDQINQNNAGRSALVNNRLSQLTDQERSYQLNRAQLKLEQQKAARDWQIAKQEMGIRQAGVTGTYHGKPTLAKQSLTLQQQNEAARIGISEQAYSLALQKATVSAKLQAQRLQLDEHKNAMSILDGVTTPGHPITLTQTKYIAKNSPENAKAVLGKIPDAHYDTKRHQWYYYQRVTKAGGPTPITDPNLLYDVLRGGTVGLSRNQIVNLIRGKLGLKDWTPGQDVKYTGQQLHSLSNYELRDIARSRGYKGDMGSRQAMTDYILGH